MKAKNNLRILTITTVLCLLPMLLSLGLYPDLPEQIGVHWNSAGVADNFLPKAWAAFGLPLLFAAINIFSKIRLFHDPKRAGNDHAQGVQLISIGLVPLLSLVLVPATLFVAVGIPIPIPMLTSLVLGGLFLLLGNYLPKCRQNYTIGIKLPWTLHDADNWNKVHRMAGHLWMLGGLLVLAAAFLSLHQTALGLSVTAIIALSLVLLPIFYSYSLYKKTLVGK